MTNKCKIQGCDNEKHSPYEECVLHCEKHDLQTDLNSGLLAKFFDSLVNNCRCLLLPNCTEKAVNEEIESFLKSKSTTKNNTYSNENSKRKISTKIIFSRIKFPERMKGDSNDFLPIFWSFQIIHFSGCHFNFSEIEDCSDIQFFFESCEFKNDWYLTPTFMAENMIGYLYQTCIFYKTVTNINPQLQIKGRIKIDGNLFYLCTFSKNIEFYGAEFNGIVFDQVSKRIKYSDSEIKINNCIFNNKFMLNENVFTLFEIRDTTFNDKIEFKSSKVNYLIIKNSNFLKDVDYFGSMFSSLNIEKSIFNDFVGFEKCIFGIEKFAKVKEDYSEELDCKVATFEYSTFQSFINFRETKFIYGLDIKNINLKQPPNFLNTEINLENTNRESFRIVKNSFDSVGNHIEANKFFRNEMEKYREELKNKEGHIREKFVFFINKISSDYGQNYLLPLGWVIFVMYLHTLVKKGYIENWLYSIEFIKNYNLSNYIEWLNEFAKNLTPMKNFLSSGFEFLSLLFYIAYVVLIYQTVVALKRLTKR